MGSVILAAICHVIWEEIDVFAFVGGTFGKFLLLLFSPCSSLLWKGIFIQSYIFFNGDVVPGANSG